MAAELAESVEAITEALRDAVEAMVAAPGSPIADVKSVVRGDRARPMPDLPSVWIVPQLAQMDQATYGEETWSLPVSIAALVQGDTPETAGRDSQRIAAHARRAALHAREAAASNGAEVTDIVSESFDPTARNSERNRTLFWTEAVVRVTFTVNE
jgi:hypothetical protein